MASLYAKRDIADLDRAGNYYCRHVSAMTSEGLHSKGDVAAELGARDLALDEARAEVERLRLGWEQSCAADLDARRQLMAERDAHDATRAEVELLKIGLAAQEQQHQGAVRSLWQQRDEAADEGLRYKALLKERIAEVERLKAELAKLRWVPMIERFPEADGRYLVMQQVPMIAVLDSDCWWSKRKILIGVTHWMPLPPDPPGEKGE